MLTLGGCRIADGIHTDWTSIVRGLVQRNMTINVDRVRNVGCLHVCGIRRIACSRIEDSGLVRDEEQLITSRTSSHYMRGVSM